MVLADEPKITDWLSVWFSLGSGVIALLALIAASIAVRATIQTNRTQTEQLRQIEESREQESATKFAAWIEREPNILVRYHNAGSLPVYVVSLEFEFIGESAAYRFESLSPTQAPISLPKVTRTLNDFLQSVAKTHIPEDKQITSKDLDVSAKLAELLDDHPVYIGMSFSDGQRMWIRRPNGRLEAAGKPPDPINTW
jgi:hypothetical protein